MVSASKCWWDASYVGGTSVTTVMESCTHTLRTTLPCIHTYLVFLCFSTPNRHFISNRGPAPPPLKKHSGLNLVFLVRFVPPLHCSEPCVPHSKEALQLRRCLIFIRSHHLPKNKRLPCFPSPIHGLHFRGRTMPDGHGAFLKKQLMGLAGAVRRLNFNRGLDRRAELLNVPFIGGAMTRSNPKERLTLSDHDVRPCLRVPLRHNTETEMTAMHVRTCCDLHTSHTTGRSSDI